MPEHNKNELYLIIGFTAIVIVIIVAIYFAYRHKKESFKTLKSEPSLTCQLTGSGTCQLSNGIPGVCDNRTRRCVEPPFWASERKFRVGYKAACPGEPSLDCLWRDVCSRMDGTMGVCMTGLCYPNSHAV